MCTASLCTRFGVLRRGGIVGRGCAGTRNDDLFYLWPLRSLFPQRCLCVHASPTTADFSPTSYTRSKIKKKKKKLVYVQPCEFVPSHFVHHLRFQSDFRFVFPPILSSSFGIFLWNNSFVDIDLCSLRERRVSLLLSFDGESCYSFCTRVRKIVFVVINLDSERLGIYL